MNIFLHELRANIKSLLIWGVIVVLLAVTAFTKFAAYSGNPEMLEMLDEIPQVVLEAFSLKAFNLTTLSGFYGVLFTYNVLLLSIAAAMWGSDIISKEERDKTVEFALTLPVTRGRLVAAKALAALVTCVGLLLITWGSTVVSAQSYEPDSEFYAFLNLSTVAMFIMQLIFLSVGILLGCAMKRYRRATSVAVSLLLATYFMSVISGLHEKLEFLKYFSPFKYFDAGRLLLESRLDVTFVLLSAGIIVLAMAGAFLTYARRDLYI